MGEALTDVRATGLTQDLFVHDDGGREAAGFKGSAGDCVVRAVAIASGRPYAEVHARFRIGTGRVRHSKRRPSPENGIITAKPWFKKYMAELGFQWVASAKLPDIGRLVVKTKTHAFAVIDLVVHDTHAKRVFDPREGYWIKQ